MSRPGAPIDKATARVIKQLQPLIIERQAWADQKKEAEEHLKEVNEHIEITMTQANVKSATVLDHKVTVAQGKNISCKWDLLRQEILTLTGDVDQTEEIINNVRSTTEYTYVTVRPIS